MLVAEVSPAPKPTQHPGRVQVAPGGVAHETQVLNLTHAEARQWAMSGGPGENPEPHSRLSFDAHPARASRCSGVSFTSVSCGRLRRLPAPVVGSAW